MMLKAIAWVIVLLVGVMLTFDCCKTWRRIDKSTGALFRERVLATALLQASWIYFLCLMILEILASRPYASVVGIFLIGGFYLPWWRLGLLSPLSKTIVLEDRRTKSVAEGDKRSLFMRPISTSALIGSHVALEPANQDRKT